MAACLRKICVSGGIEQISNLPLWLKGSCLSPALTVLVQHGERCRLATGFQPCATAKRGWKTQPKRSWNEIFPVMPNLKPVGPEDYHRWRGFIEPARKPKPARVTAEDVQVSDEIFSEINKQIEARSHGRLFAVIHVAGKQFKITTDDIIVIQGNFPPAIGDVIRLEKTLAVGSADFTLIGRPMLGQDVVNVEATVIEKTLSHIMTNFRMKRRKQYRRINFYRSPYTMLRINNIQLVGHVNEVKDVEGLDGRVIS